MKWFSGKVDIAIQVSARNKAVLVVFIDSDDERGEEMDKMWNEIDASIITCNHIAVKIKDEVDVAKILSLMPDPISLDAPISLFLSSTGEVIDKITEAEVSKTKDVIKQVVQKLAPKKIESQIIPLEPNSDPSTSSVTEEASTSSLDSQTQPAPALSRAENELLMQEKINRARVLLEQKKKADAEQQRREEKKKELERVKEGKLRAEAQRKRQEKEMMEAAQQRISDRNMVEQERLRVRAQVLADREERDFRKRSGKQSSEYAEKKDSYVTAPVDNGCARILVRFTDGKTITGNFESSKSLQIIVDSINESGFVSKPYTLVRSYPSTVFVESDYSKTFAELQLAPSCVLYVKEEAEKTSFFNQGFFSLLSMLVKAPYTVLIAVYALIFGRPQARVQNTDSSSNNEQASRPVRDTAASRRQRVGRLHSPDESASDSDENPNWNGNSTQFL